ncbi:TPA: hypothetical protein ACKP06_003373 [Serratia marcescens]|uniref:hypothetical protein n=1 Tax=Serratia ureilytica TaxID=300181 RepID=UPI0018D94140|nr:hypothetical protein [Serratia ureilytica]MBH3319166.1 hypothetical protein [Serratia ureilytica]
MGLDINFIRQRKADYPMLPVNGDWTPVGDWVPCSPAWLEDGGDCSLAPRIYNHKTCCHYHPPIPVDTCHFRGFTALMDWMGSSVAEVNNAALLELDRNDIQMLDLCLSRLNEANCHEEFPSESRDYDSIYWAQVDSLKEYVNNVLAGFDFSRDHLYFRASW